MPLTDTACKNARPKEKPYKKADGGGLYLEIMPTGARYWRLVPWARRFDLDGRAGQEAMTDLAAALPAPGLPPDR